MTDQEKQEFDTMKAKLEAREGQIVQIKAENAERAAFLAKQYEETKQQHAMALAAAAKARTDDIEKVKAEHAKKIADMTGILGDMKIQNAASLASMAKAHDAEMATLKKNHAAALLKEKQRVDRMEFEARQAAELAKIQE
jgi:hypothetical protein